jgi:hypothetical protein
VDAPLAGGEQPTKAQPGGAFRGLEVGMTAEMTRSYAAADLAA